jgi:hypothetical protein
MILKAMEIACSSNIRRLNYVVGILRNWENESVLTLDEIDTYYEKKKRTPNIITNEEINHFVELFNIGKRPLSLALGWGEATLTRYLNGDIPTKQYSQIMRSILKDPLIMESYLESNKDKISEIAYANCRKTIEGLKKPENPL